MSVKSVILAVALAVPGAGAMLAQAGWHEYVSRDEFFLIGMPSDPQITSTTYRAASGAMLPAKQFVATDGKKRYTVTDRKSTRLNSSHVSESRMPSSA